MWQWDPHVRPHVSQICPLFPPSRSLSWRAGAPGPLRQRGGGRIVAVTAAALAGLRGGDPGVTAADP